MPKDYKHDNSIIHETVIRDIIDIVSGIKDSDEVKLLTNRKRSFSSIAKASSNLVLVFPCIVSTNCDIIPASIITKAVERKAVSMLQILFSAISITDAKDAFEYIAKFHTNLKFDNKIKIDDFIDTVDHYVQTHESTVKILNPVEYNRAVKYLREDMKNINNILSTEYNTSAINEYKVESKFGDARVVKENDVAAKDKELLRQTMDKKAELIASKVNRMSGSRGGSSKSRSATQELKDKTDFYRNQLLPSDVRKANELVPSMMVINFVSTGDKDPIQQQVVVGVKAKMYPVDSADILNRIVLKNQDRHGLLKLIKATTREISFCRDFLFAIDRARLDALSQSRKGTSSQVWKMLERRALKGKIRRAISHVNDASAITTIVITQEEVEYLKKTNNIDVSKPSVIRPIMEAYNLIGFCIVDEVLEVASFIWDTGDDIYERLSFDNLEKENTSNDYKKIINLMSKVSR